MSDGPRYFPVSDAPLKMTAGLSRHGTDFGQGAWDRRFFQEDRQAAHYLAQKRHAPALRHGLFGSDAVAEGARAAALAFMHETLAREAPEALEAVARAVQEDFAVLAAYDEADVAVAVDVRFPSGFRSERLLGQDFHAIHRPVPGFVDQALSARSMVRSMTERGPYVRFVWALSADDALDHHPDVYAGSDWQTASSLFLRVERQTTVPLFEGRAALFLIRTYVYPYAELSEAQRGTLTRAIARAPEPIREYKRLPTAAELAAILARMAPVRPE
jgi:hypothetical protein